MSEIRAAVAADVPAILGLIRELAAYEREPDAVLTTEADLTEALFGADPLVHCLVVGEAGRVVGMALWFVTFSTWEGKHGIYLEDLYVQPEHRGKGYGRAFLARLAQVCLTRGYRRLEWTVLDWNEPALGFYRSLGAVAMDEWTVHRVTGSALAELATGAHGSPS